MKPIKIDANTAAMVINTAIVATAGFLCWKLKRMAPALLLFFMMTTSESKTTTGKGEKE